MGELRSIRFTIVIPINIGRDRSIKAINQASDTDKWVAVFSQRDLKIEDPTGEDLYEVGTLARILKMLRMPDGSLTAVLRGRQRIRRNVFRYHAATADIGAVANCHRRHQR